MADGIARGARTILAHQAGGRQGVARVRGECFLLPRRFDRYGGLQKTRATTQLLWQRGATQEFALLSGDPTEPIRRRGRAIAQGRSFATASNRWLAAHRRGEAVRPRSRLGARAE